MNVVDRYNRIAAELRFQGWPLVGEPVLGVQIPFLGQVLNYTLRTPDGDQEYTSLLRHFGWAEVFGITTQNEVVTLVQWKPGVNQASWELPPGGIGRVPPGMEEEELVNRTSDAFLRETGYGGGLWHKLGHVMIETGKYRGVDPDDHGLPAHLFLAMGLEKVQAARQPAANEIMETLMVPLEEFDAVIDSREFVETSAVACALLALRHLRVTV